MALLQRTYEPAAADDATAVQRPVDQPEAVTETDVPRTRRRWWQRRRVAAAGPGPTSRAASAGAGTTVLIARLIRAVAGVVALIIALGIAFVVLKATPTNTIVSHIHSWAKWLVGPFDGMFHLHSARGTIALNWGIGLVVYLLIGALLARIVTMPARALARRRTTVPA